jgi:hypothetical protein
MSGSFIVLDETEWFEIEDRRVHMSGNVYVGKGYKKGYDVRVFLRKFGE